jgi:hypothetical protein
VKTGEPLPPFGLEFCDAPARAAGVRHAEREPTLSDAILDGGLSYEMADDGGSAI